jgi:hypothetical protein
MITSLILLGVVLLIGLYLIVLGHGVVGLPPHFLSANTGVMAAGFMLILAVVSVVVLWIFIERTDTPQAALYETYRKVAAKGLSIGMKQKLNLPYTINTNVELLDMTSSGPNVQYIYRITPPIPEMMAQTKEMVKGLMRQSACQRDDIRNLFRYGVDVQLLFLDGGPYVDRITATAKDCGV